MSNTQIINNSTGMLPPSDRVTIPEADKLKFPKTFVFAHIAGSGLLMGSFVGATTAVPIYYYKRYKLTPELRPRFSQIVPKASGIGALTGLALLSAAATKKVFYEFDQYGIEDRAFRLYYNRMMNLWNPLGYGGLLAGAAYGLKRGMPLQYSAVGAAVGTLAFFVANYVRDELL